MDNFERRQKSFENKFMHDEELHFKATARAIKILARDMAPKIGRGSEYSVIILDALLEHGPRYALQRLTTDTGSDADIIAHQFQKLHDEEMKKLQA
jgi:hypothetical protein